MKKITAILLGLFALCVSSNAQAALVTYNFTGYLTDASGASFAPAVTGNADSSKYRFTGAVSFDTAQVLSNTYTEYVYSPYPVPNRVITSANFLKPASVTFTLAGGSTVNLTDILTPALFPDMGPAGYGESTSWVHPSKNSLYYEYAGEGKTKSRTRAAEELLRLQLSASIDPSRTSYFGSFLVEHFYQLKDLLNPSANLSGSLRLAGNIDSVSQVPLPGAVLLFGSGMIGLAAMRRRRAA